jgi:hypothetical protein
MRNNIQSIQVHNDFSVIPSNCSSNPIPQNPDLQIRLSKKFLYISSKLKAQLILKASFCFRDGSSAYSMISTQLLYIALLQSLKDGEEAINQKA